MAQIKATIELLLRILRENGTTRVSAETFRQAKFDHKDAVCTGENIIIFYACQIIFKILDSE